MKIGNSKKFESAFSLLRNIPYADIRRMYTKRCTDIHVSLCGVELCSWHETTTRGKVISLSIHITSAGLDKIAGHINLEE